MNSRFCLKLGKSGILNDTMRYVPIAQDTIALKHYHLRQSSPASKESYLPVLIACEKVQCFDNVIHGQLPRWDNKG